MGNSSDDLARQIAGTRVDMEARIVELRRRGERTVRRTRRLLLIGLAAAVVIGAGVTTVIVVYRYRRPPTFGERLERVLPEGWWDFLRDTRREAELRLRRRLPPVRVLVGEEGEAERQPFWQRIGLQAARTLATSVAAYVGKRLMEDVRPRRSEESAAS